MRTCRRALQSLCLLAATVVAAPAPAQDYPARPVRIITDAGAGSAIDVVIRIFAERLTQLWGQPVVIVNQPGGGGAIAARAAAQSAPDGYTLFVAPLSTFVTTARHRQQSPDPGPAGFPSGRLSRRRADDDRRRIVARGEDAAGIDRATPRRSPAI